MPYYRLIMHILKTLNLCWMYSQFYKSYPTVKWVDLSTRVLVLCWAVNFRCFVRQVAVQWHVSSPHYIWPRHALSRLVGSDIENRTRKYLSPLSNLCCQSFLNTAMSLMWLSPHKTGVTSGVWWSRTIRHTEVCFHGDACDLPSFASWLSICIIWTDQWFYNRCHSTCSFFPSQWNVLHVSDAWSCEWRIRNGVFQGRAFWSGISLPRSYSQWHSRSPWKDILGCIEGRLEYQRSKTLIRQAGGSAGARMCRMWRVLSSEAQWHSEESLKCHFKLSDRGSAAGAWWEFWSNPNKRVKTTSSLTSLR